MNRHSSTSSRSSMRMQRVRASTSKKANPMKEQAVVSVDGWLSTILPLGAFLFMLVAITLFMMAPLDIPKNCDDGLHQKCLEIYSGKGIERDGPESEVGNDFPGEDCGHARMHCWRSGFQNMLYSGRELPQGTTSFNIEDLPSLTNLAQPVSNATLSELRPELYYCECLMSNGGSMPLPAHEFAWRTSTDYFCPQQGAVGQTLGTVGLILACLFVMGQELVKTYEAEIQPLKLDRPLRVDRLDSSGDNNPIKESDVEDYKVDEEPKVGDKNYTIVLVLTIAWLAWSVVACAATKDFAMSDTPPCTMPDANPFFYVFMMSLFSLLGAIFGIVRVVRVIQFAKREIVATRDEEWREGSTVLKRKQNKELNIARINNEAEAVPEQSEFGFGIN